MAPKESKASFGDLDDKLSTLESRRSEGLSLQQVKVNKRINNINARLVIVLKYIR